MFGEYGGCGAAKGASTRLHWSQDPAESLSDWTVELRLQTSYPAARTHSEDVAVAVQVRFHCHSNILGVGPASSEYFARIFRSGAFAEDNKRTSVIELPFTAAQAFPVLLDFMYDCAGAGSEGLKATNGNAVALLHLSNYFAVRKAHEAVTVFIAGNLTYKTAIGYLLEAETYTLDKVSAVAIRALAFNAEHVLVGDFDLIAPPELFLRIVQSPEFTCHSQLFSKHVNSYCAQHRVDAAMLCRLTDTTLMPKVSPCVANQLLREALAHQHQPLNKTCAGSSSLGNEGKEGGPYQIPTSKRQRVSVEPELVSAEMDSVGSVASGAAWTEPLLASLRERCVVSAAAHYGLIFSATETEGDAAKAGAPHVQQQSMGMPEIRSCIIVGATGPNAALVNGTYHAQSHAQPQQPQQAANGGGGFPTPWEAVLDFKTGKTYFHNTTTGMVQWAKPGGGAPLGSKLSTRTTRFTTAGCCSGRKATTTSGYFTPIIWVVFGSSLKPQAKTQIMA